MVKIKQETGLDKTIIKNLQICGIDRKKLYADKFNGINNNVKELNSQQYTNYETGESIPSFAIIDNLFFGELTVRTVFIRQNKTKRLITHMELNASHILSDNRNNITLADYKRYIFSVLKPYLMQRYGVDIDLSKAEFRDMEINMTLCTEKKFSEYRRVLSLFESMLPGRGVLESSKNIRDGKKESVMFGIHNRTEEFVMYNKQQAICQKYNTEQKRQAFQEKIMLKKFLSPNKEYSQYMENILENIKEYFECVPCIRFEIKLHNNPTIGKYRRTSTKKIEKVFGVKSAEIELITDEMLCDMFQDCLYNKIMKKYVKWYNDSKKRLRKLAIEYKKKYNVRWQENYLLAISQIEMEEETPVLLDLTQLRDILNFDLKEIRMKHNIGNIIKGFERKIDTNEAWNIYARNDSKKVIEILDKLGLEYREKFISSKIPVDTK